MAGWEVKGLTLFCSQREYAGSWSGESSLGVRGCNLTSMNAGICCRFPSSLVGQLLSLSTTTTSSRASNRTCPSSSTCSSNSITTSRGVLVLVNVVLVMAD